MPLNECAQAGVLAELHRLYVARKEHNRTATLRQLDRRWTAWTPARSTW
jgi:hypothetical protein